MSDATDLIEITQLILRERQGRDRGWWQQMRDAFADASTVRLSWYTGNGTGFVDGSERMSGHGDKAVHRLAPPVVHVHNDRAIAEVSCAVEFQVSIGGIPAHLISYTRLNYRLIRHNDRWLIQTMDAIYERDTLTPAFPGDTLAIGSADSIGLRPSYALLSYYLRSKGYTIGDDLLGDDIPEAVDDFYTGSLTWLNATPHG